MLIESVKILVYLCAEFIFPHLGLFVTVEDFQLLIEYIIFLSFLRKVMMVSQLSPKTQQAVLILFLLMFIVILSVGVISVSLSGMVQCRDSVIGEGWVYTFIIDLIQTLLIICACVYLSRHQKQQPRSRTSVKLSLKDQEYVKRESKKYTKFSFINVEEDQMDKIIEELQKKKEKEGSGKGSGGIERYQSSINSPPKELKEEKLEVNEVKSQQDACLLKQINFIGGFYIFNLAANIALFVLGKTVITDDLIKCVKDSYLMVQTELGAVYLLFYSSMILLYSIAMWYIFYKIPFNHGLVAFERIGMQKITHVYIQANTEERKIDEQVEDYILAEQEKEKFEESARKTQEPP